MILTQKTNADPPEISQFPAGHFGTFVTAPLLYDRGHGKMGTIGRLF
jgi:hypothetical protein